MRDEYDLKKLKRRSGKTKFDPNAGKVATSLRIDASVSAFFREEANRTGVPYQTLINSILHQYSTGEHAEKKTIKMLQCLMSKRKSG